MTLSNVYVESQQKINIPWSEPLMVSMNRHLGQLWNDWRCAFRAHFYKIAGKPPGPGNTALGKVHPHPDVPDKADWDWLCDFWSREAQLVSIKVIIYFLLLYLFLHYNSFMFLLPILLTTEKKHTK